MDLPVFASQGVFAHGNGNNNRAPGTRLAGRYLIAILAAIICAPAQSQVAFEDVSAEAGMTGFTESWGASWGDLNGDNRPDLFIQGHRDYPRVYRNTGEGDFEDIAFQIDPGNWIADPLDDKHGGAFADFDNDGDDDFLLGVSATGPGQLLVNNGNLEFDELADEANLNNDSSARMPMWLDYTNDGYLDVIQYALGTTRIRRQDPSSSPSFLTENRTAIGFSCNTNGDEYGHLLDANGDGVLDLFCSRQGLFPNRLLDVSTIPFQDLTFMLPSIGNVNASLVADFNNDLLTDFLLIRGAKRPTGASLANNQRIESWMVRYQGSPAGKGFAFSADAITVTVYSRDVNRFGPPLVMNLNLGESACVGTTRHEVCASYDAGDSRWEVVFPDAGDDTQAFVTVDTTVPVTGLVELQSEVRDEPIDMRLLLQSPTGFDYDLTAGLNGPVLCGGGTVGDFNNDMYVDIYLTCRDGAENLPNRLYLNQGDGTFALAGMTGAEGPMGTGFDTIGTAETAVAADYDVDGFLDLAVVNGLLYFPAGAGGPDILLRNLGNSNNWLEIDLQGTTSNRDGVGARVFVTAGGVQQLREANGGYQRFSQDHQRLHFGLAGNLTADVTIEWPSGQIDTYTNVQSNSLYEAVEGQSLDLATLGPPVRTTLEAGDECGQPPYHLDYGPAVLLWRDCPGTTWHFRARGGREDQQLLHTAGIVAADAPFSGVTGFALTGGDTLLNAIPEVIQFDVGVWFSNNKGFDFDTAGQTSSCFQISTQDIPEFIVGASGKRVAPDLDLVTLAGGCEIEPPPIDGTPVTAWSAPTGGVTTNSNQISYSGTPTGFTNNSVYSDPLAQSGFTDDFEVVFTIDSDPSGTIWVVGLGTDETSSDWRDIEYALRSQGGALYVYESGVYVGGSGSALSQGDIISIYVNAGLIEYRHNGVVILTSTYVGTPDFYVDTSFREGAIDLSVSVVGIPDPVTPLLSIDDVTVSEDVPTGLATFTVNLSVASSDTVTVDYASSDGSAVTPDDYTAVSDVLTFLPGETSQVIDVPLVNDPDSESNETFTVTLSNPGNALLGNATGTATIVDDDATPVTAWASPTGGVTTNGNQISYSGTPTGFFSNTVYSQLLALSGFTDDFEVVFTIDSDPSGTTWVVGLGTDETNADWRDVEYALRSQGGALYVYESGVYVGGSGSALSQGDIISIYVNAGLIEYRHNGVVILTSTYVGTPDFYVDTSFRDGAIDLSVSIVGVPDVIVPPTETPIDIWTGAAGGVTATGDSISYSGTPTDWVNTINSAALSSFGVGSDYTAQWTIGSDPAGTTWVVGLGVTESGSDWRDIDYGLRSSSGSLDVRESGTWLASGGALNVGDTLAIRISGTTLEYLLNGIVIHSSTILGTENFYIDTAFKQGAIDLDSFKLLE